MPKSHARTGFAGFEEEQNFGKICRCLLLQNPKVCSTDTDSPVFVRRLVFAVSSVTPKRESLHWSGAQKNSVRFLWASTRGLLRPHPAAGSRSVVRRHAHLSRFRSAARGMPELRQSETRAAGLLGRQPVLHQALRLLRGAALSLCHDQGHRRGTQAGLARG